MFKELSTSIKLTRLTLRTQGLIDIINDMASNGAIMSVIHLESTSDTQVRGKLRLNLADNEVVFGVLAPTSSAIVNYVSRYNMACSQCCNVSFQLINNYFLKTIFLAPNDSIAKEIDVFFSLTCG